MSHNFSQIPRADIQRSSFDRSHGLKTTFNSGYLVPVFVDEVLPGDTFNLNMTSFARLSTPVVPIMDNLFLETFFFFVPSRLVWDHWQAFNGEQKNPGDSTDFVIPTINTDDQHSFITEGLADYLGIPPGISNLHVNALPFRCYNLIWNEWFRDENLQDSVPVVTGDSDSVNNYKLLRRGKRHDYFTSCLPFPQKGPGVNLPLVGDAPVYGDGNGLLLTSSLANNSHYGRLFENGNGDMLLGNANSSTRAIGSSISGDNAEKLKTIGVPDKDFVNHYSIAGTGLYTDLSGVTAVTINSLRQAFQLQRLYEADARGGTRYTEILRSHFGVISPDARLQRPEYLGGSSTPITINPVTQTSSTNNTSPQGNLAAFGYGGDSFHGFTKSFVEHGYIIGLVNVRADLTYQQGLERMWSRQTRFDFYWPTLAHLGEQAVLNKEIFAQGTTVDDDVFGYQERYAEYRYKPSKITGKFRSTYAQSLDVWHLSQKFNNLPVLNSEFIQDNPPIDRVVAVTNEPQFLLDCYFKLSCVRPMPVYSVPGLIDHF